MDLPRKSITGRNAEARAILDRVLPERNLAHGQESFAQIIGYAATLGVRRVIRQALQSGEKGVVDGMLIPTNESYVIAINGNVSKSRQLYSLAHEVGHLVIHNDPECKRHAKLENRYRSGPQGHSDPEEERLCEAIAAELLMPEELFVEELERLGRSLSVVSQLAEQFQTSITSTAIRLWELIPTPCLLVRWTLDKKRGNVLHPSWQMRNHIPGPHVQLMSKRGRNDLTCFSGAEAAWMKPGPNVTFESLLTRYKTSGRFYTKFHKYETESLGFGRETNRFVLSAVYLDKQET